MKKESIKRLLEQANNLLSELPTKRDCSNNNSATKDVMGTAFANLLIGAGIDPYNFRPNQDSESYLRQGHSHTSEMRIWHFHSSIKEDKVMLLKKLEELVLK